MVPRTIIKKIKNLPQKIRQKKIRDSKPFLHTNDKTVEIHTIVSKHDILNLLWCLKSFYHFSSKQYQLYIHSDGTLHHHEKETLTHHFPNAIIPDREKSNNLAERFLSPFPLTKRLYNKNFLIKRIIDFSLHSKSRTIINIDTDILFFKNPVELTSIAETDKESNFFNKDLHYSYSLPKKDLEETVKTPIIENLNAGLAIIQKKSLCIKSIEHYISCMEHHVSDNHWAYEQTLMALLSCQHGVKFLTEPYSLYDGVTNYDKPVRHYAGQLRPRMYKEGLKHLVKNDFLKEIAS